MRGQLQSNSPFSKLLKRKLLWRMRSNMASKKIDAQVAKSLLRSDQIRCRGSRSRGLNNHDHVTVIIHVSVYRDDSPKKNMNLHSTVQLQICLWEQTCFYVCSNCCVWPGDWSVSVCHARAAVVQQEQLLLFVLVWSLGRREPAAAAGRKIFPSM